MPLLLKDGCNAQHVVAPRADAFLGQSVEIKFEIAGKFFGVDQEFAIRPGGNPHVGRKADGRGHDVAVVVVGVFADQIDAARRAKYPRKTSEAFLKNHARGHACNPAMHERVSWSPATANKAR